MKMNVQERAMEILKPWVEAPYMNALGMNVPVVDNKINTLKGMETEEAKRRILSNTYIKAEIMNNPELADALIELIEKETAPVESKYVLTERFPRL